MRSAFDYAMAFGQVVGSAINERTKAMLVQVTGIGSMDPDEADDENGELGDDSEAFGALGVLSRPPDPEQIAGKDYAAETVCVRTSDGLTPVAWRDLRIERFFPNGIPAGRVSLAGYGGGFHTIDLNDDGTNIHVIYLPYAYSGGTPTKAHAIVLDPEPDNGITITSGEGYQVALTTDGIQMRGQNQNTCFFLKDQTVMIQANEIRLKGNVIVGSADLGHLPLTAGPASPPCPTLWLSPA